VDDTSRSAPPETETPRAPQNGHDSTTEIILATLREPGDPISAGELRAEADAADAAEAAEAAEAAPAPVAAPAAGAPVAAVPALQRRAPRRRTRRSWRNWEPISRVALAFTIASLLWYYVLTLENPSGAATFTRAPITTRGLDNNLSLSNDPGTVTITVQAPQDVLTRLRASDFTATVDLTGRGPGSYRLPVNVVGPNDVQSVSAEPSQVQVQVVEVSERRLTVTVTPQGRPSIGYRIETQQVNPRDVLVRGPRDAVERIDQVVAEVNVENKQGTQDGDVHPRALDFAGNEIPGLVFKPEYVHVAIAIQQLLNYKTLPIHVPVEGAPAPGYRVTDIVVQPTTLTAYGLPSVLEPLNFLETAPVSIGGATQTLAVNITVPLTSGLTLYPPGSTNRVQVRVQVEELSTKTQLSVLVHRVGLAPGLTSVESPDRIEVTVTGPFDALQDLKPDSVSATLDLTGYGVGTYKLIPAMSSPPNTNIQAVDQGEVTVTISAAPTPTVTTTPIPAPSASPGGFISPGAPSLTPAGPVATPALPIAPAATPTFTPSPPP
jgi:YbbR domain-containing protein